MSSNRLARFRSQTDKLLHKLQHAKEKVSDEKRALRKAKDEVASVEEAQQLVQTFAQRVQQEAHDRISSVVSRCLASVFDQPYEFVINFERKRGRTEARLVFTRDGHELHPRSVGGGVLDVAAFALRLASIMLRRPKRRKLVIMDEPFKNVHSPVYRERVRELLETLAKEMHVQFIMSTGIDELQAGKVIQI